MARESKQLPKWRRWLKEEDLGKRLLIGVVISLSIASFIHFREIRIDSLEIDTKAKDYVVAQVDFEFPDEVRVLVGHGITFDRFEIFIRNDVPFITPDEYQPHGPTL